MSNKIEKAVQFHHLNRDHYPHDESYAKADQIGNSKYPLRGIEQAHCSKLDKIFRNYNQDYSRGALALFFSSTVNPDRVTYPISVKIFDGMKLLKDCYHMVMLDGRQRCPSVEILRRQDGVEWAMDVLHMCNATPVDGQLIPATQTILLSRAANISTANVECEVTFTYTTQSLLSFA